MAGKGKRKDIAAKPEGGKLRNLNALPAVQNPGEDPADILARTALHPTMRAAFTIKDFSRVRFGELDLTKLVEELANQSNAVHRNDLSRGEAMLTVQAHTLDAIFAELARRAALNMGEYINAAETYLRLALRAQNQCRATWETLAAIKNPPGVAFVRQQNIGVNQQVNNGPASDSLRARETEIEPSKLSGESNELLPDSRAPAVTGGIDPQVETVGEIDRTKDAGR